MKKVLKKIALGLLALIILGATGFFIFKSTYMPSHLRRNSDAVNQQIMNSSKDYWAFSDIPLTKEEYWQEKINDSDRVNVLLFGTDGQRADTLIFLSYSKEDRDVAMLTIPRDTKHNVKGMDGLGQDKINAVFCFPGNNGGSDNQRKAIEKILGVPIHYYIKVNYGGLESIVDTIGGVEIDVERDMNYDDRWATPELHIHLDKGLQVLDGNKAMQYIRWRKNNNGTGDSDLERTKRQQEFLIAVVKKSFGINIIEVVNLSYDYVKTDMNLRDLLYYATELIGFDLDSINKYSLPGEADYTFYYQDVEKTKEVMKEIYE